MPTSQERQKSRTRPGDPYTELVFVGEAPGEREDEKGTPFVGRGGRKLDELLQSTSSRVNGKRVTLVTGE